MLSWSLDAEVITAVVELGEPGDSEVLFERNEFAFRDGRVWHLRCGTGVASDRAVVLRLGDSSPSTAAMGTRRQGGSGLRTQGVTSRPALPRKPPNRCNSCSTASCGVSILRAFRKPPSLSRGISYLN